MVLLQGVGGGWGVSEQANAPGLSLELGRSEITDALRFCMAEPFGGKTSPSGIVCTGAFDPTHLRSGNSVYEGRIQKILAENIKYGVRV